MKVVDKRMTVEDLIKFLQACDPRMPVFRAGGEYNGDWRRVERVTQNNSGSLSQQTGVYIE